MVFAGIVVISIICYIRNYKVPALFAMFFLLTSGFNLVPETMFKFAFISKGTDYALLILFSILFIDCLFVKNYLRKDDILKFLVPFGIFLAMCIVYSKFSVGLGWVDIIRTCRYQFFWLAFFIFRNMEKKQLESLLKSLFVITAVCSFLFILQIFIDETILNETEKSEFTILGTTVPRFYNQPDMLCFFVFMALYCNLIHGTVKKFAAFLLVLALTCAFHRSQIGFFLIAVGLGFVLRFPRLRRIKVLTASGIILLAIVVYGGAKLVKSGTISDLNTVISGNIVDANIDITDLNDATFTFRIAHLLERNQYLLENPKAMIIGAGLIPEDSKKVDQMFDFKIGLLEELTDKTVQLDTGDISYSILLIRMGYLGTLLYLMIYGYLMVFFYKKRDHQYAFSGFLFLVMSLGISFFSSNFVQAVTYLLPLISYNIVKKT
jgi:hypothetical protein